MLTRRSRVALSLCHSWVARRSSRRTGHSEFPTLHGRLRAHVGGEIESSGALVKLCGLHRDQRGVDHHPGLCFDAVRICEHVLVEAGLEIPSWREHPEPNGPKFGWQHLANMSLEEQRFASPWAELSQLVKALWRSQRGRWRLWFSLRCPPAPGLNPNHSAFGCVAVFAYPFLSPSRTCRCGHRLDKFGHHRAVRWVEVIADGLLWHGAQLAIDTTLVPPARRWFSTRKSCRPQRFSFAGSQTKEGEDLP